MYKHIKVIIFYIVVLLVIIIIARQKQELKQLKISLIDQAFMINNLLGEIKSLEKNDISNLRTKIGFSDYDFKTIGQQTNDSDKSVLFNFLESETLATGEPTLIPFDESFKIDEDSFLGSLFGGAKHVTIRPADIWSLIIRQISTYLKHHIIDYNHDISNRFDWGDTFKLGSNITISNQVIEQEFERVLGTSSFSNISNLISLVKPLFSKALPNDNIAILSQLFPNKHLAYSQGAFYSFNTAIPNIRILGIKKDYIQILEKLELIVSQIESNLYSNNNGQLSNWMNNVIKPIIKEFIEITPESSHTGFRDNIVISSSSQSDFWKRILDSNGFEHPNLDMIDGWISSFFYFTDYNNRVLPQSSKPDYLPVDSHSPYFKLSGLSMSTGYSVIPINMLDVNGNIKFEANLFGGHISVDIIENYKFSPRLDWVLKKVNNENEKNFNIFYFDGFISKI